MAEWYSWVGISPLIKRLVDRFNLQETPIDPVTAWILHKTIQPVTLVDELLKTLHVERVVVDISAAGATAFTVPPGKRWQVFELVKEATIGSTKFSLRSGVGGQYAFLTPGGTGETHLVRSPFPMAENWYLQLEAGGGEDDTIGCEIIYQEEDAY